MLFRQLYRAAVAAGGLVLALASAESSIAQQPPQPAAPMPAILENYKPVTADRLKKPDDGDWLLVRRTYDGWGYSPLDQITTTNVNRLQPIWVFSTGVVSGHEAPPVVNNGVMFVATPMNQVIAIEAKTGRVLWRYRRPAAEGSSVPHQTTRGVAVYGDKVFFAAEEAVLMALDARSGKEVWATKVDENRNGYYMTMAPLVADGKVLVGTSGGNAVSAVTLPPSIRRLEKNYGERSWYLPPESPAVRPGLQAINGRRAAPPSG